LGFRKALIDKWEAEITMVPEAALVGQYLASAIDEPPSVEFAEYIQRLDHRADEWDMSGIISKFLDRVTTDAGPTDYYPIVRELALLMRNELREVKMRFQLSIENARADKFVWPYRMHCPRTDCGFVFVPLTKDTLPHRRNGLQNFTLAHKYDLRATKCMGVAVADDINEWFTTEWCYVEFPWEWDAQMERLLRENYPFREIKQVELPRYDYKD
jgi:hypothetical protein